VRDIKARLDDMFANGQLAHGDVIFAASQRIAQLEAALREARRWIGDGECSDGLDRGHWTPEYAAAVDLVDAALGSAKIKEAKA
jgi:hypothetical protein